MTPSAINGETPEPALVSPRPACQTWTYVNSEDLPLEDPRPAEREEGQQAEKRITSLARFMAGRESRALTFWLLVAFVLRLFLLWHFEQVISPDGVQYVALARSLIAGNFRAGLSIYSAPLYPAFIGIASLIFRDIEFGGRFVSVLAGSLLVLVSHRLIRNWYGPKVAIIGAALVALHPLLIYYSTTLLTESTYTFFFTAAVLAGWSALSAAKGSRYLLAGAIIGTSYLLKPEAAGFVLLLVVMALSRRLFTKTAPGKESVRNALLICAGFLLVAAPYLFYLRHQTGTWTLSGKTAAHLWQGSRRAGGDFQEVRLPLIPDTATAIVQLTKALRFEYEIFNLIFPPIFVLLVGLGLFRKRWSADRVARELYLFSFVAATLAGYAITLPNIRFLVPLLPILLCWVAKGIVEFADWVNETLLKFKRGRTVNPYVTKAVVPILVVVLLVSLLPLFVYLLRGDKWSDYYGQKRAAEWIRAQQDRSQARVIMSTVPIAAFYLGGRNVSLVDEDYGALITRARREQVGYLIVNERDFRYMRLGALLDERSDHPGLRLATTFAEAPGHKIVVYAVAETPEGSPWKVEMR
jgi:4-amino-4-deoxy-L-arabinose transferase-like glycosyltransferase